MNLIRNTKKAVARIYTKSKIVTSQKKYGGIIDYLPVCFGKRNQTLVVVFSGFAKAARYNYVNTLSGITCPKAFILDNFGYRNLGSYYLGIDGDNADSKITELITYLKNKTNANRVITCGSSKGGTAALLFGLRCKADYIICGGPQYYIANYLLGCKCSKTIDENEYNLLLTTQNIVNINRFMGVYGSDSYDTYQRLNDTLKNEIVKSGGAKAKVLIQYSVNDHMYQEHIVDLIADMKAMV